MLKKIICLIIVLYLLAQSNNANSFEETFIRHQVNEYQLLKFGAMPGRIYEITFDPLNIGKWQIEISHYTELLSNIYGSVAYAVFYKQSIDKYVIEGVDIIRYKESDPVILIKDEESACFKFYISNEYEVIMDIDIFIMPYKE